jgi:release factor glutamine methyltransferase
MEWEVYEHPNGTFGAKGPLGSGRIPLMTPPPPQPPNAPSTDAWTTSRLLDWMTTRFEAGGVDGPRVMAEILLAEALGGERIDLYADPGRPASQAERDCLKSMVRRAIDHEPVQYITGQTHFLGRSFFVDRSTLIPRAATESLVQHALAWLAVRSLEAPVIADIGTGTGCIGITMALQLTGAMIIATDLSADAIALAQRNAADHGIEDRVTFLTGNAVEPLIDHDHGGSCDVVLSNPPYIPHDRMATLDRNVRDHEPAMALDGGSDGLDIVRRILVGVPGVLKPGGLMLIEIDDSHAAAACDLAAAVEGLCDVSICRDDFGDDRFIRAVRTR